jgi:NADH-ubiquinone oxidoreductase chain 5
MSAFLTNRVGDCFLTIGMFAILWSFGKIDYSTVFSLAPFVNENIVTIIGICLLIGAMAKSSQVGLHVWLPMAMEGPTPVSALIHAATMVTAGVYLLMRTSPLIEYSSTVLILCLWLGAITTIFSSLIGLFQQDIKKVIAYSTMSQLGMMVIAVGLSSYNIALFHLVNHAFYKGLLFLGAGAVIHAVADNQDFRKYGGLRPFLPLTYSVMLIASLSLVAFPFMTGFYSKDFILESAYGQFYFSGIVVYFIATVGAMFTTLYSVKVLYLTFLTNPNGDWQNYAASLHPFDPADYTFKKGEFSIRGYKASIEGAHEGDIFMSLPLIILAIFSIFFGYITKDIFIGLGSGFFADNSLFIHPTHEIMLNTDFAVPSLFKLLPLFFTISFSVIAIIISEFLGKILITFKFTRLGYNIFGFFNQRFLIELFYNKYITGTILKLGGQTTKVIDKGSVELLGPYGLEKGLINLSRNIVSLDTGVITSYALYILIGLIFYILIPYLSLFDNSLLLLILLSLFSIVNIYTNSNSVKTEATLESNILGSFFNSLCKYITRDKVLIILFIIIIALIKVYINRGFYPLTLSISDCLSLSLLGIVFNITRHAIGSTLDGVSSNKFSTLNFCINFYNHITWNIFISIIFIFFITIVKVYLSGGFDPLTFSNLFSVLNKPLSFNIWYNLGLIIILGLNQIYETLFASVSFSLLIPNWNSISKISFINLIEYIQKDMFYRLPLAYVADDEGRVYKPKLAVNMDGFPSNPKTGNTWTGSGAQSGDGTQPGTGAQSGNSPLRPNEVELQDGSRVTISDGAGCRHISGELHVPRGNPLGGPPEGFKRPGVWYDADGTFKMQDKHGNFINDLSLLMSNTDTNKLKLILSESDIGKQLKGLPGAEFTIQRGNPLGGPPAGYRPPGLWRSAIDGRLTGYLNLEGQLKPINIHGIANTVGPINWGGPVSDRLTGSGPQSGSGAQSSSGAQSNSDAQSSSGAQSNSDAQSSSGAQSYESNKRPKHN